MKIKDIIVENTVVRNKLFHGTSKTLEIGKSYPFKLRESPRDTDIKIHNLANNMAIEKFGVPIRNLLFSSINPDQSISYGNVYEIEPVDKSDKVYFNTNVGDFTLEFNIGSYYIISQIQRTGFKVTSWMFEQNLSEQADMRDFFDKILEGFNNKEFIEKYYDDSSGVEFEEALENAMRVINRNIKMTINEIQNYIDGITAISYSEFKNKSLIHRSSNFMEVMIHAKSGFKVVGQYS